MGRVIPFDHHKDSTNKGTTVIEASAGTGKTYSIEQIVRARVIAGTPIDRIVLTSFTRAAAAELAERVRGSLAKALSDEGASSESPRMTDEIRGRLEAALLNFDAACITTIDGFCLRMLQEHAAAAGAFGLAEWQLDGDSTGSEERAVADAWSATAMVDEEWAATVKSLANVKVAAAGEPKPNYAQARERWAQWIADSSLDAAASWLEPLGATLLADARRQVAALVLAIGTTGVTRRAAIGHAVSVVAEWFTNPAAVVGKSKQAARDRSTATALCAKPLCATLCAQFAAGATIWKACVDTSIAAIAYEARVRLDERRTRLRLFSFQDVLDRLAAALRLDSDQLCREVRARFSLVVVDECQDMNPVQAEILERLFRSSPDHDLYLVGDPKQSIYAFRGADLNSFIQLRDGADHQRSLSTSYRSDEPLLVGVNALFEVVEPFFHREISPGAVHSASEEARVKWKGATGDAGVVIHRGEADETLTKIWPLIAIAIEEELAAGHLVRDPSTHEWRALRPGDLAVLCHSNKQAERIAHELRARAIPVTVLGKASVFESDAAREVAQLVRAVARPSRQREALAACAGRLVGMTHAQALDEPAIWTGRVRAASGLVEARGISAALERIVDGCVSPAHGVLGLSGEEGGEQFLLDYRQLLELLTRAEGDGIRGASALDVWIAEQIRESAGGSDGTGGDGPARTRSIGTVDAVTVQTLHSSKGLTYGITWLPTFMAWQKPKKKRETPEELANAAGESRRLLYVGLTRSRWRSHLVWAHEKTAAASALATVVHARGVRDAEGAKTQSAGQLKSFDASCADLAAIEALAPSAIIVKPLPRAAAASTAPVPRGELAHALEMPKIPWPKDQVSFSSLARKSHSEGGDDGLDRDQSAARRDPLASASATASPCDRAISRIPLFGKVLGTALHEALAESAAFASLAPSADRAPLEIALREQVNERAKSGGSAGEPELFRDLARELALALASPSVAHGVAHAIPSIATLASEPRGVRREWAITTPWRGSASDIARAFADEPAAWSGELAKKIADRGSHPLKGLFVGNIDLVAHHNGAWFIYDYKSNHLGSDASDYSSLRAGDGDGGLSPLDRAMVNSLYPLQAALYAVALERWLAVNGGHDARRGESIGGIAYLYLRGMDASVPGQGIWEWKPSVALIRALECCLAPTNDEVDR